MKRKIGIAKLGFPGKTGHDLRKIFVTTLANDPHVTIEESMRSAAHNSFAAQRPYILPRKSSEAAKFAALGIRR